jgi:hypothetical protein
MRPLLLVLFAVVALVAPSAALAAGATGPTARYFLITGMVLGDQKADAEGKLSLDGSQLTASVGCNTIGGTASLDGDMVTISGPLAMTEMGCPSSLGDVEAMLIKVLQHGPFAIGAGAWTGDGASLVVEELPAGVPGPKATAPEDPVSSSPGAVITDPSASCPPLPSGLNGTTPVDGGPGSAGGSGGSTGSGTTGGGTVIGPTGPDAGSGSGGGTTGSDQPRRPSDPNQSGAVDPDPGFTGIASDPGIGTDPGVGKPVILDPCDGRMYAVDQANGAGAVPPNAVDAAAEHATSVSDAASLVPPLTAALLALAVLGLVLGRRWRAARATPR